MAEEKTTTYPTAEDYIKQADEEFAKRIKQGNYQNIVLAMSELGKYSLRNQMLIMKQNENATDVNGMRAWNFQGRFIKQGEKSIKIVAPVFETEEVMNEDGTVTEKALDSITGYKVNFVFDVAQTQGKPVENYRCNPERIESHYDTIKRSLENTVKGFDFKYDTTLEKGVAGIYDGDGKVISIRDGMDKSATIKTLINQVAIALVNVRNRSNFQGLTEEDIPNIKNIEASGITHLVAKRMGLSLDSMTTPVVKDMSDEQIAKLAGNMNVMRSISQRMITTVENDLGYELRSEKQKAAEVPEALPFDTEPVVEVKPEKTTVSKPKAKSAKKKAEDVLC